MRPTTKEEAHSMVQKLAADLYQGRFDTFEGEFDGNEFLTAFADLQHELEALIA